MIVNDFKWVKGENDYEYIQLLEAECKRKDEIISRAINKLKADRKTENCSEKPNNCEPQTDYKKWDAPPKVKLPTGEITTCVSVLAAAFEEASAFEDKLQMERSE